MPRDRKSFTDAEIREGREIAEKQLGRPLKDDEVRATFGRVPGENSGSDNPSSRTISVDEPGTSQSGRHAAPSKGVIARILGGGKKKG